MRQRTRLCADWSARSAPWAQHPADLKNGSVRAVGNSYRRGSHPTPRGGGGYLAGTSPRCPLRTDAAGPTPQTRSLGAKETMLTMPCARECAVERAGRSEERRVGKSVDVGGRRVNKKNIAKRCVDSDN